jgi:hypothetical protein
MADVLKVSLNNDLTNSAAKVLDGVTDHIYTVMSVIICETAGNAETFDLYVNDSAGGTLYYIYLTQALPANGTFEHTATLILDGTDELTFITDDGANVDVIVSYYDQDNS